jgi:hypothetical protein
MDYHNKLKAIVIVSEDNLFVTHCLSSIRTIHEEAFVERVFGFEDFVVLMRELIKEAFDFGWIIIDHKTRGEDIILLYKEIEQFKKVIDIQTQVGMNGYHVFQEV